MKHASNRAEHVYKSLAGIPKGRNFSKTLGTETGDVKTDTED
jgi:hypothetical protein